MPNQGIRIGERSENAFTYEMEDQAVWINGGVYTIFDTAASEIYLSILWYESFVDALFSKMGIEYETKKGATYARCNANYPNIYFMLDGQWLQIPPVDYILDVSEL